MEKKMLIVSSIFMLFIAFSFTLANAAEDWATKEECEAKVKETVKMIGELGLDAVTEKVNRREKAFRWKDSYVFITDTKDGTMLAHPFPPVIGRSFLNVPDSDGKLFVPEIIDIAMNKGEGWVNYKAVRRASNENLMKSTFVAKVPDKEIIVCAGYFIPKEGKSE